MKKKWNQYRNSLYQKEGKKDTEDLIKIENWLIQKYTGKVKVRREWFLRFSRENYKLCEVKEFITEKEAHDRNYQLRWPDIIVCEARSNQVLFVVELDGWIHDAKLGKTWERNADYEFAGVKLIIINKEHLKLTGEDWFSYLEKQIDKLNIELLRNSV